MITLLILLASWMIMRVNDEQNSDHLQGCAPKLYQLVKIHHLIMITLVINLVARMSLFDYYHLKILLKNV